MSVWAPEEELFTLSFHRSAVGPVTTESVTLSALKCGALADSAGHYYNVTWLSVSQCVPQLYDGHGQQMGGDEIKAASFITS